MKPVSSLVHGTILPRGKRIFSEHNIECTVISTTYKGPYILGEKEEANSVHYKLILIFTLRIILTEFNSTKKTKK